MSRSDFGIVALEPIYEINDKVDRILLAKGFRKLSCDGEEVWTKENLRTNIVSYIKTGYAIDAFICSAWVRIMNDESHREYFLERYPQGAEETKEINEAVRELVDLFYGRFRKETCYVYE